MSRFFLLLVFIGIFLPVGGIAAQSESNIIEYGQTRSRALEGLDQHTWEFSSSLQDAFEVTVRRISGQFTPNLTLTTLDGTILEPSITRTDSTSQTLTFWQPIPSESYQIRVDGKNVQSTIDNPAEYSLTLSKLGTYKTDTEQGLNISPLGSLDKLPPTLPAGTALALEDDRAKLAPIEIYGDVRVTNPDPASPQNYILDGGVFGIQDLSNGNVLDRFLSSISFTTDGIGFVVQLEDESEPRYFFTDQSIRRLENTLTTLTIVLVDGTSITTDFYQIASLQAQEGLIAIRTQTGNRIVLDTTSLIAGKAERSSRFSLLLENDRLITTDLQGWQTLSYLDQGNGKQVDILSGSSFHFSTTDPQLDVAFVSDETALLGRDDPLTEFSPAFTEARRFLQFQSTFTLITNTIGMGDIVMRDDRLEITTLDGRTLTDTPSLLSQILIDQGRIQVAALDGTYRYLLPNGVEVQTPIPPLMSNPLAIPTASDYTPSGYNNLGVNFLPNCPCMEHLQADLPVNGVNGNFYYAVQDFYIPSSTLELDLTRHYNSLDSRPMPDYFLANTAAYMAKSFGAGWRHSYQIDLDLSNMPYGQVTMVFPDGARHSFNETSSGLYLSATLPMWKIERLEGILGTWLATRTDGLIYRFQADGQLNSVEDWNGQLLTFSPAPLEYLEGEEAGGLFVIEPYGRRQELYSNAAGLIQRARDPENFQHRYAYNAAGELASVLYFEESEAQYAYINGLVAEIKDIASPYHSHLRLTYNRNQQVETLVENPDGISRSFLYTYDAETRVNTRLWTVNGLLREDRWEYDEFGRLVRRDLPREEWFYRYEYNSERPQEMTAFRTPQGVIMRFRYDEVGGLTSIIDPVYGEAGRTDISYLVLLDGFQRVVSEIKYANAGYDRFTYNEQFHLTSHARRIREGSNDVYLTRYEYDEQGRLLAFFTPSPEGAEVETRYTYDSFGYVATISEGNGLRITHYVHDRLGRLRSVQDGRGNQTAFNWDNKSNLLVEVIAPLNYTLQYEYNLRGQLVRQIDRGAVSEYTYNNLDQVATSTNPLGQLTSYRYDEAGNLLETILADGVSTYLYEYDSLDNLQSITSPSGLIERFEEVAERTSQGNPTGRLIMRRVDSLQRSTDFIYDPLGRLRQLRLRDRNGQIIYDYSVEPSLLNEFLRVERLSSARGRNIETRYNLLGLPTTTRINGTTTSYDYNAAGYLRSVRDSADRITLYEYDVMGNVVAVSLPITAEEFTALTEDAPLENLDALASYRYEYDENGNLLSRTDPNGDTAAFVYDALNRLQTISDPQGNQTTYGYDERSNLVRITDPNGNVRTADYDELDNLRSVTDNMSNLTSYEYDLLGRLLRVNRPRGLSEQYTYDADNNVIAITRPEARNDLYSYDAAQRLISFTDALGHTRIYTYDRLDQISRVVDPLGNSEVYRWSSNQRLRNYTNTNNLSYEYLMDQLGRLERVTARNQGNAAVNSLFRYDDAGNIISFSEGSPQVLNSDRAITHRYSYTTEGWLATYTDPEGHLWQLGYDATGQLISAVDPRGVERRYEYDENGHIIRLIQAANTANPSIESYEYDPNGNLALLTEPDGKMTRFNYNGNNQLTQMIEGVGTETEQTSLYDYDELGYLKSFTDPTGQRTEYFHNQFGDVVGVVRFLASPDGAEPQAIAYAYEYDAVGNLIGVILPEGIVGSNEEGVQISPEQDYRFNLTYNALDRPVRYVDAEDNVWAYQYDSGGRLLEVSDPLGSVIGYRYDVMGRIDQITYPNGATVQLRYNSIGQLNGIVGARTEVRTFKPTERVSFDNTTITYELDRLGNLLSFEDVDRSVTIFTYDENGNLTSRQDALENIVTYSYDDFNRLTEISSPEGSITRRYDAVGQLISLNQGSYDFDYTYNMARQLTTSSENGLTINYTYDLAGNVLTEDAGRFGITEYTYDSLYRVTQIKDGDQFVDLLYDRNGWLAGLKRSNGVETAYTYNTNGDIELITHAGPNGIIELYTYTYDSVGNVTRINNFQDGSSVLFSYDVGHQVINERWLSADNSLLYAANYRYDEVGNRVETIQTNIGTRDQSRTLYIYDRENQLIEEIQNYVPPDEFEQSAIGLILVIGLMSLFSSRLRRVWVVVLVVFMVLPVTSAQETNTFSILYEYDANGSLIGITYPENIGGGLRYSYDSFNRLIQVTGINEQGQQVDTRYEYDPLNRLVEWQSLQGVYQLHYSGQNLIAMENLETGEIIRYNLRLPSGEPLLTSSNQAGDQWHLMDTIQSTRWLTDSVGANGPQRYSFNAFGETITPSGPENALPIPTRPVPLYTSQLYDPTTDLYLMDWRSYSPRLGRFIQRDPIRHDPNGSLYNYAYNRPYLFADPTGLTPLEVLAQTDAAQLPQELLPQILPQDLFTPQAPSATIASLQAAETARTLQLSHSILYQVNEFPAPLDEQLSALYIYGADQIPDESRALMGDLPAQILPLAANRWQPLSDASPALAVSPFAAWEETASLLDLAQISPLKWQNSFPVRAIDIPTVDVIPFDTHFQQESHAQALINEIPLLNGFYPEIQMVQQSSQTFPQVLPNFPVVILPTIEANPIQVQALTDLRQPQLDFYMQYLTNQE